MNVPIDIDQPLTTDPVSAVRRALLHDPDSIPFWWERGALTAWPAVPLTLADDRGARPLGERAVRSRSSRSPTSPAATRGGALARLRAALPDQHRPAPRGRHGDVAQQGRHALVGPGLPARLLRRPVPPLAGHPRRGRHRLHEHAGQRTPAEQSWDDGDYYWNGGVTMPRSAQQGPAVINLYAPQYAPAGGPLSAFDYLPYTHAYFPTERFDEVRQVGGWTFGKRGNGYVALWSWRPTEWREHDPAETFTNGLTKPFDLVAPGGANNVWISQVGDAARWKTFDAFVAAMTAAPITVTDLGSTAGVSKGFDVSFRSPTEGAMRLGWTGPFTVGGNEVPLHRDRPRSPTASAPRRSARPTSPSTTAEPTCASTC